jgi:hypothetical protein
MSLKPNRGALWLLVVTAIAGDAIAAESESRLECVPAQRLTTWNPGLSAVGGIPRREKVYRTLSPSGGDDTAAIQEALDACPENQVVQLGPGTFRISGNGISMKRSNVVLRGSGPKNTKLVKAIGSGQGAIYLGLRWYKWTQPVDLAADAQKGATSVTLARDPGYQVGELVMIDEVTDPSYVVWRKTNSPGSGSGKDASRQWFSRYERPVGQILEVAEVSGKTVRFTTPLHIGFDRAHHAQLVRFSTGTDGPVAPLVKRSGVEDMYIYGGEGGDDGGNVHLTAAAYSWVKNVESDYAGGTSVNLNGTFRCEVRDSFVHDTPAPRPGGGGYGIGVNYHASDNLIENNISIRFNKVMVMRASGGGNVVAYNYMDDGWIDYAVGWMEVGLNATHMTHPHYELFEGNQSFNFDADNTWGNASYITVFRNHLTGHTRTKADTNNRRAVGLMTGHWWYTFVGNVLGYEDMPLAGAKSFEYEQVAGPWRDSPVPMWKIGYDPGDWKNANPDPKVLSTLIREGNYDHATRKVVWSSGAKALPDSLYLKRKPDFFGNERWPWVDPTGAKKVHTLPARARYDANSGAKAPPRSQEASQPGSGAPGP